MHPSIAAERNNDIDMDELRRSVAEVLGEDPETWPVHGNAALAIASAVALTRNQLRQQPVRWLPDGTPVGDVCDEILYTSLATAMDKIERRNGWNFDPNPINWPELRAVVAEMQAQRLDQMAAYDRVQAWAARLTEAAGLDAQP